MPNLILTYDHDEKEYRCYQERKRNGKVLFPGRGKSIGEAVGNWVIANREMLGFTMEGTDPDGVKWLSTEYGKPRFKRKNSASQATP